MKKKRNIISKYERWEVLYKLKTVKRNLGSRKIKKLLLKNRGIENKVDEKNFLYPLPPNKLKLYGLGIDSNYVKKAIRRIKKARDKNEKVIVFGDYDVDGVCSTAILWEFLYTIGLDILPYIPERFSEGYGIKIDGIIKLKKLYPSLSLIITVDNGIVAHDAVLKAKALGIDIIIVDHHEAGEKYPSAYSVIHTTKLCAAAISWVFVRELDKNMGDHGYKSVDSLELAALGTIADQMPQKGVNRSIIKFGLESLNNTKRKGLNALYNVSGIKKGNIGIYEINFIIAPRLNAMGRMKNAIESLRLICTKNTNKAYALAVLLNDTNRKRQETVDRIVLSVEKKLSGKRLKKIIIVWGKSYHEGVVGLVASKLTEEFFRPAVVISRQREISKGSARSILGFNIIKAIKNASDFIIAGGGHKMAAGFSLETRNIPDFKKKLEQYAFKKIKKELLEKKLKIDLQLEFSDLTKELMKLIDEMRPFGVGNFAPSFLVRRCDILDVKRVGTSGNHIKFKLKNEKIIFDAILFNSINDVSIFNVNDKLDIVFNLEENLWNGNLTLQLKIKDLKLSQ